jgi:hypothetical protein
MMVMMMMMMMMWTFVGLGNVLENIKSSATESLGYYDMKQHKRMVL